MASSVQVKQLVMLVGFTLNTRIISPVEKSHLLLSQDSEHIPFIDLIQFQ
jgi:hypothetical protein